MELDENLVAPGSGKFYSRMALIFSATLLLLSALGVWFVLKKKIPGAPQSTPEIDAWILEASDRYAVDPLLVKAVIWKESRFNIEARGAAGEVGLMQILSLAALDWASAEGLEEFDVRMLEDPRTNVLTGSWYLAHLMKRYLTTDNPIPYTLADYNAGRSNVLRWWDDYSKTNSASFIEQIGYPSTQRYVLDVMKNYDQLRKRED
jgi:soluble lytic murein transglycosylase